jgi:hypothetical protein
MGMKRMKIGRAKLKRKEMETVGQKKSDFVMGRIDLFPLWENGRGKGWPIDREIFLPACMTACWFPTVPFLIFDKNPTRLGPGGP